MSPGIPPVATMHTPVARYVYTRPSLCTHTPVAMYAHELAEALRQRRVPALRQSQGLAARDLVEARRQALQLFHSTVVGRRRLCHEEVEVAVTVPIHRRRSSVPTRRSRWPSLFQSTVVGRAPLPILMEEERVGGQSRVLGPKRLRMMDIDDDDDEKNGENVMMMMMMAIF